MDRWYIIYHVKWIILRIYITKYLEVLEAHNPYGFKESLLLKVGDYSIHGKPRVQKQYYLLSFCTVRLVHRVGIIIKGTQ